MNVITQEEFARPEGIPLCFDLFHPGIASAPSIVYIHGGGWISGDRSDYAEEAEWAASQGYAAFCIDYRLAPLYPFPTPVIDCRSAINHIRKNASRFDIDPLRIAAFGNSAGGHLATMLGVCREGFGDEPFEPVAAVVDVCGLTDVRNPDTTQFPISMSFVEQFLGGGYIGNESKYAAASPLSYANQKCCPFLIVHGTEDDVVPVDQSRSLASALQQAGGDVTLLEMAGEGHGFSLQGWDTIREETLSFLGGLHAR